MLKKKFIKGLALAMAMSTLLCNTAFATPIDLRNSVLDVQYDSLNQDTGTTYYTDENNEWNNGTISEEVRVKVDLASKFDITIPKEIVLNGEDGTANYKVKAVGDIAGDQVLKVVPDVNFVLSEAGGKADVTATVTQADTEYVYTDLQGGGTNYDGAITATLSAGEWSGKFNFNINFKDSGCTHEYNEGVITKEPSLREKGIKLYTCQKCEKTYEEELNFILENLSWTTISEISKAGFAADFFSIGDTKEMTLSNSETYNAEIIGFNHDDLADGTGTAGITFQFKECMTTEHNMNTERTNVGGWEASEMRSYVNNDVYNLLPSDLQTEIKEVSKVSDTGNKNTTNKVTTTDKLFLPSLEEVGLSNSGNVAGQGVKYVYYSDNASRIKYKDNIATRWWLRSTTTKFNYAFQDVNSSGGSDSDTGGTATNKAGVAPAFCI